MDRAQKYERSIHFNGIALWSNQKAYKQVTERCQSKRIVFPDIDRGLAQKDKGAELVRCISEGFQNSMWTIQLEDGYTDYIHV